MKRFLKGRWLILLGVLAVALGYMGVAGAVTTTNTAYYYPYPQTQAVQQVVPALSVPSQDNSQVQPDPNAANQAPQYNYQNPGPWMYGPGPNTNAQPYGQMYQGGWGHHGGGGWGCW